MIYADDALISADWPKVGIEQANGEQMTPSEHRFNFDKPSYTRTQGLGDSPTACADGTGLEGRRGCDPELVEDPPPIRAGDFLAADTDYARQSAGSSARSGILLKRGNAARAAEERRVRRQRTRRIAKRRGERCTFRVRCERKTQSMADDDWTRKRCARC